MSTDVVAEDLVIRPVRDSDAETLGRVHAQCWHEDYDELVDAATMSNLSPRRMAELWTHRLGQGDEYAHYAALSNGEIVGFAGAGPSRDPEGPRERELYFIHLLNTHHGQGIGQQLFDAAVGHDEQVYLWVPEANTHAIAFYERNGFTADGSVHDEPFLGESIREIRVVR